MVEQGRAAVAERDFPAIGVVVGGLAADDPVVARRLPRLVLEPRGDRKGIADAQGIVVGDVDAEPVFRLFDAVGYLTCGTEFAGGDVGRAAVAAVEIVRGGIGGRGARLVEMPDSGVRRRAPDGAVGLRGGVLRGVGAPVGRDLGGGGEFGDLDPDERRSAGVPGVDFVGEEIAGRVGEAQVDAALCEAVVRKTVDRGVELHQGGEVRQGGGACVAGEGDGHLALKVCLDNQIRPAGQNGGRQHRERREQADVGLLHDLSSLSRRRCGGSVSVAPVPMTSEGRSAFIEKVVKSTGARIRPI